MSDNNNPVRGTADLSKIRSQSYDLPRNRTHRQVQIDEEDDMGALPNHIKNTRPDLSTRGVSSSNIHFAERPQLSSRTTSFATPPNRPKMSSRGTSFASIKQATAAKRKSLARTISAYSLYSNFAGERLDDSYRDDRPDFSSMTEDERKSYVDSVRKSMDSSATSVHKHEESGIGEEFHENVGTVAPKASVGKAMFMFLKAFIGSGVLFLPKAFQNGGLALSIVLMIVIAAICFVAFMHLVKTQHAIGGSYGDIGGVLYGKSLRYIVLFFIAVSQIGFVCSYFIFVSGNLVNVVDVLSNCASNIEQKYYVWFPLIILIPFSLVRHIAKLSFTAIAADILILFGLICVLYFTGAQLSAHGVGPNIAAVNPQNFALMIGTATFSFEGIGLIIPIVESMESPEKFDLVLALGMVIVCVIYILIGTISYLAYGDTIQSAVIYNFPSADRLTISVQLLYSLAICLTAPLMLFPALKIIENCIFYKFKSGRDSIVVKWSKNVYRCILCVFCAALAFAIGGDNLDKFVSLVGSVACVPLCFIFPGMFHLKVFKGRMHRIVDIFLIVFGVGILVYTLYVTCDSFVNPKNTGEALAPYCPS